MFYNEMMVHARLHTIACWASIDLFAFIRLCVQSNIAVLVRECWQ